MAGEAVVHYRGEIASHTRGGAHLAKRVIFLLEYESEVYNLQKCREAPLGKKISTLRADLGKNIHTRRFFENIDKICDFLKLFMKDLEFLKDYSLKLQ